MSRKKRSEEQIVCALRQVEGGAKMGEVCRELGVTEMTYFRWKKQYAGLGMPELRRLKQLEDEMHSANKHHRKRRGLVARASGAFPNLDSLDTVDNFLEADSLKV